MAINKRHPPLPHWNAGKGHCRWCGKPVHRADGTLNLRALWHPACVIAYKLATRSATQRQLLWRRDKGRCAACGTTHPRNGAWAADHIHPLHLVDRTLDWHALVRFWSLENLQTLCQDPCHAHKTVAEHRARHLAQEVALAPVKAL